jgi:HD-GYP domain-containing protein (c-di-GMP phosphodiesterase class II)
MRTLLVHSDRKAAELLAFILEGQYQFQVEVMLDSQLALERMLEDSLIDLLICEDNEKNLRIMKYLLSTGGVIPTITIGNKIGTQVVAFPDLVIGTIESTQSVKELDQIVKEAIASGKLVLSPTTSEYCRIKTSLLTRVCPLKADVYIRLSNIKFVKVFKEGDIFDKKDLEKFLNQKKIDYLYLKKDSTQEFVTKFSDELSKLVMAPATTPETASHLAASVHEALQELGNTLGFTPEVQQIAKNGVMMTMKSIGQSPSLSQFLSLLKKDKDKYITSHSVYLAQVACVFAAAMEWPSGSTFQKLTYAAFFHDIVLTNQMLAQVDNLAELEEKKAFFTPNELIVYKNHPMVSAEVIRKFSEIPADVDTIIMQHHERPDGKGFPRGAGPTYVSPLSCLFIIAHDFVDRVILSPPFSVLDFVEGLDQRYHVGNFRKISETLKKNKNRIAS